MSTDRTRRRHELYRIHEYTSKNLRFLRCIKGYSQTAAANKLGMSRTSYYSMESGKTLPDLLTLCDIADFYDVSPQYLISFDITEHLLSLIRRDSHSVASDAFIASYLKLSHEGREQIQNKLMMLMKQDREFNIFPWDYNKR